MISHFLRILLHAALRFPACTFPRTRPTVTHECWSDHCFIQYIFRFFYMWPVLHLHQLLSMNTWHPISDLYKVTITAVTYIVGLSRTWYARLLFLVFLRVAIQKQETSNQMKTRPAYCNFRETSLPYSLPVPCELEGSTMVAGYKIQPLRGWMALYQLIVISLFQEGREGLVSKDIKKLRWKWNKNEIQRVS